MGIVTSGLLAYYNSLQGVSGTNWANIAPGAATGTDGTMQGTSVTTFQGSTGMYFAGSTSDYVTMTLPVAMQSVTDATLEYRVNCNTSDNVAVGYFISSDNEPLTYVYQKGVALTGIFDTHYSDWIYQTPTNVGFTDSVDNYITITCNTATRTISAYVNGVFAGSYQPTTIGKISNDTKFRLGSATGAPTAIIDNVRIYNRVLTQAEITQNYNNGTAIGLSTNASVTGVAGAATASSGVPTVSTQKQINITGVAGTSTASAGIPIITATKTATISGVVGTATASSGIPSVTATKTVSVTGVVATATASAGVPTISVGGNASINAVVGTSTASAGIPSITATKTASITSVVGTAAASSGIPSVSTTKTASITGVKATATASAGIPSISTFSGVTVQAIVATATAFVPVPFINGRLLSSTVYLNASRNLQVALQASKSQQVALSGNQSKQINLKGVLNN